MCYKMDLLWLSRVSVHLHFIYGTCTLYHKQITWNAGWLSGNGTTNEKKSYHSIVSNTNFRNGLYSSLEQSHPKQNRNVYPDKHLRVAVLFLRTPSIGKEMDNGMLFDPKKEKKHWYRLPHGWTLKTWCYMREARCNMSETVRFHLCEMSRIGQPMETDCS